MAFELPRVPPAIPNDYPGYRMWWASSFLPWWQQVVEKIETQEAAQDAQLALINAAQAAAVEYMADIPMVVIAADHAGTVDPSNQLPKTVACKRYNNTTDVTALSTWSRTVLSGGITCSINASTGVLTITALTSDSVVQVTSVRTVNGNNVSLSKTVTVDLQPGLPPNTGSGGGSTAYASGFNSFNSDTFAAVTDELTVTVAASGEVDLDAPLAVYTDNSNPDGNYPIELEWRWWNGAAYVAVGTSDISSPDCSVSGGVVTAGAVSLSRTKTGLAPAASEKFQLYARNITVGSTTVMSLSGTASAVSS